MTDHAGHEHPVVTVPCCPELVECPPCDVIDMHRRLLVPTRVRVENGAHVTVEVLIHTRFTRCSGPLALGDPIYTTTLLPGEKVRLATTDRRSRFSFDSETNLSYRSEQMSEDQYRMSALRSIMSDQHSTDHGSSRDSSSGSWDFSGEASAGIGFFSVNADSSAHGSHNAESTSDWLRQHSSHASMADRMSVEATRKAHSMSVGEVSTRSHKEGETEDHFEASSREFTNPNRCHAVTYFFYRINKCETIKFELVAIQRRVVDPAAPTPLLANPIADTGGVGTVPQEVPATAKDRLDVERRALESVALKSGTSKVALAVATAAPSAAQPLPGKVRAAALAEVDDSLRAVGLIDAAGKPTKQIVQEIEFTREGVIPTGGILVKGCLDECNTCEPELQRKMELELEHLALQNALLQRQIELLDKSQEYRCCPVGESDDDD